MWKFRFNLLVLDVQGAELDVLRGGAEVQEAFDYVIAEIQNVELYEGGALFPELVEWMGQRGFACERVEWRTATWGDALFVHERVSLKPRVHGFIFHWHGKAGGVLAKQTHVLTELIGSQVDELTVISSGGRGGRWAYKCCGTIATWCITRKAQTINGIRRRWSGKNSRRGIRYRRQRC